MAAMDFPISPSLKKWPEPTKAPPSPLKGEGGGARWWTVAMLSRAR